MNNYSKNQEKEKEMQGSILVGARPVEQPKKLSGYFLLFCIIMLVLSGYSVFATGTKEIKPEKFTIIAHNVHRTVTETGENLIEKFRADNELKEVEWRTFGLGEIIDTLYRESSLPTTEIDVGFTNERSMSPRVKSLFMPLDGYLKSDPPEDFKDFFPGMIDAITLDGKLYGIPIRSVVNVIHYNKSIFAEKGITGPPETIEELIELARQLTFTRANGEKVFGFAMQGAESVIYGTILAFARAWNGDFITPDYEVVIDQEPVIKAVKILRDMHADGILPGNFNVMTVNDNNDLYKANRVAMTYAPAESYAVFNNPATSLAAGNSEIITPRPSKEFISTLKMASPTTSFWLMVIPQGAQNKDLSWEFIKYISSKESQVQMTFNGNGPTRASVFSDQRVVAKLHFARIASEGSKYARPIWPAFDAQSEAQDILGKEAHKAIFAGKDPAQAMKDAAEGIRKLVENLK